MSWIKQSLVFAGIAVLCAFGTYLVHGEYDRTVPCVQSELAEHEVCLSTVMNDWAGDVIWVDARAEEEKEVKFPAALEITEANTDEDLGSENVAVPLFKAKMKGLNIVVFCQTDACGSSKLIRAKIIDKIYGEENQDKVFYLHGGWKAIASDGRLLGK